LYPKIDSDICGNASSFDYFSSYLKHGAIFKHYLMVQSGKVVELQMHIISL